MDLDLKSHKSLVKNRRQLIRIFVVLIFISALIWALSRYVHG